MKLLNLDVVMLAPEVIEPYMAALNGILKPILDLLRDHYCQAIGEWAAEGRPVGEDLRQSVDIGVEYFVTREDGGGWIATDVTAFGAHWLTVVWLVEPGQWWHKQSQLAQA